MKWNLLVAVFGLTIAEVASFAEGPPDEESLSAGRATAEDDGFFATSGVVRFQLVQGRLCLDCPRHRKGSQNCDQGGVYESITVTADRGIPSLHYVCQSASHQLTLSVQQAQSMRIESWFPGSGERSVLEQPDLGIVRWKHTRGDLSDQYSGSNLLHLRHANPELFDQHFGGLIQRLLRGQSLQSISRETERRMLGELASDPIADESKIRECVEQLRAKRVSERMAAERQLLSWGTPVVPSLHRLLEGDVDAEQCERIKRILNRLRPMIDDTPTSLAKLLVNDRSYWSRIAPALPADQLQLANHHLQGFGVAPINITSGPVARIAAARD
jgi:hypothetical protein